MEPRPYPVQQPQDSSQPQQFSGQIAQNEQNSGGIMRPQIPEHPSFARGVNAQRLGAGAHTNRMSFLISIKGIFAIIEVLLCLAVLICVSQFRVEYALTAEHGQRYEDKHSTLFLFESFDWLNAACWFVFIFQIIFIIAGLGSIQIGRGNNLGFNIVTLIWSVGMGAIILSFTGWGFHQYCSEKRNQCPSDTLWIFTVTFSLAVGVIYVADAIVRVFTLKNKNVVMQQSNAY